MRRLNGSKWFSLGAMSFLLATRVMAQTSWIGDAGPPENKVPVPVASKPEAALELLLSPRRIRTQNAFTLQRMLEVEVKNISPKALTLARPGDGSFYGWRAPSVGWSVLAEGESAAHPTDTVPSETQPRCGNHSVLSEKDLFEVAPGDSETLLSNWRTVPYDRLAKPGKYRLVFYYQAIPPSLRAQLTKDATPGTFFHRLQGGAPQGVYRSNEIEVELTGPK